ncbi:MAG TPA: hypothetical protein DCL39_05605 [Alteromonas macleodii]|nr:hypothetical protein [Alteromonas macleodii]|tara:strand:- start:2446 stop:3684 length:1239 start_codon:yes stop_codon:yes gene_type:complete
MAEWKKILLEGDANNATGGDGIEVDVNGVVSADLKANGGLVIESAEIAVDLAASSITGTLAVGDGGTGITSAPKGSVLVANAVNTISALDGGGSNDGVLTYTASTDTIAWSTNTGEPNQNAFSTIEVSGQSDIVADSATDTLTFVVESGVTSIVTTPLSDAITFGIANGGIDTIKLADGAVETAKIDTAAVTFAKLAPGMITDESEGIANADNDTHIPTNAAVIDYVATQVTASDLDFQGDTGGELSIDLDSEVLTIAGTTNEIETSGSGNTLTIGLPDDVTVGGVLTVTGNTVLNGNLDVNGTLTTIDTQNLQVEDHLIQLNNTTSPTASNANDGGIEVMSGDATADPRVFWSSNSHLAGWSLRMRGNATTAGRIMVQGTSAGDPTAAPIAGVGTMHYASTSKSMFVYVDS